MLLHVSHMHPSAKYWLLWHDPAAVLPVANCTRAVLYVLESKVSIVNRLSASSHQALLTKSGICNPVMARLCGGPCLHVIAFANSHLHTSHNHQRRKTVARSCPCNILIVPSMASYHPSFASGVLRMQ